MNLGIADMISLSTDELVERGVPRAEVTARRHAMTGHRRALSPKWLRAVGGWGGVLSHAEIASRVGVETAVARDYAKGMNLRAATRRRRSQAELAVSLWCDRSRPSGVSCLSHGVLPVERVLYCASFEFLLDEAGVGIESALHWSIAELRQRWTDADLNIEGSINAHGEGVTSCPSYPESADTHWMTPTTTGCSTSWPES
jgi:hypothetical protein